MKIKKYLLPLVILFQLAALLFSEKISTNEKDATVEPGKVRIRPDNGIILGNGAHFNFEKQVISQGVQVNPIESQSFSTLKVTVPSDAETAQVEITPPLGRWNLRDGFEVRIKIKNIGKNYLKLKATLKSNRGPTDTIESFPIEPEKSEEITIPFAPLKGWNGRENSVNAFASNTCSSIQISTIQKNYEQSFVIESVKCHTPEPEIVPEWLGKKPPVDGDWSMTFEDNFNGTTIDSTKWNIKGANYWDKISHFSKDNVTVGGGMAQLRFEKKTGPHNDEPDGKVTDYTTGYLDTYGKWTQKYGYFESRLKSPVGDGLFDAFWLMPDRGAEAGGQPKRQSTKNGGMEFDIFEHFTGWGPYRYNIALHRNGYEKDRISKGTDRIYGIPDKDGFITAGLLWLPGLVVFYCNGKEIGRDESADVGNIQSDIMYDLVSGGWDNTPLNNSQLPLNLVIDYVRVWQRKDLRVPSNTQNSLSPK
ncbi:MAG: glycoside hydrolase family 16 protein [Verrucomicrobiota bacterium]